MPETVQCAKNTKTKKANAVLLLFNLTETEKSVDNENRMAC